jgi:hypothetical protein
MEAYADPLQYFPPDPANETNPQQVLNHIYFIKQCPPSPLPDLQPLRQAVITMGKENIPTPQPQPARIDERCRQIIPLILLVVTFYRFCSLPFPKGQQREMVIAHSDLSRIERKDLTENIFHFVPIFTEIGGQDAE